MTKEYAIIARVNDETAVHYIDGTIEDAKREAIATKRMIGADFVAIAEVCGYVDSEGSAETY